MPAPALNQSAPSAQAASTRLVTHRSQGFTLIETVVTIAIIAIAMTGIIAVWSNATAKGGDQFWQVKVETLGSMYLDKVAQTPYHTLTELQHNDADINKTFNALTQEDYRGFSVSLALNWAGEDFSLPPRSLKKAVITVTAPLGNTQRFVSYKGALTND